jgi:ankyrin repeat protein
MSCEGLRDSLILVAVFLSPTAASRITQVCQTLRLSCDDQDIWQTVHDCFFGGPLLTKCTEYRTSCIGHATVLLQLTPDRVPSWAALQGHCHLLSRLLLLNPPQPKQLSDLACTAASRGHCGVLMSLTAARCDLTKAGNLGRNKKLATPMQVASKNKEHAAAQLIVELTASPEEALLYHVKAGSCSDVQRALDAGAEVGSTCNSTGGTALHTAAARSDVLALLLPSCDRAVINKRDAQYRTALVCAVDAAAVEAVEMLLDVGAVHSFGGERESSTPWNCAVTPCAVLRAVAANSVECVKLLLSRGVIAMPSFNKKAPSTAIVKACSDSKRCPGVSNGKQLSDFLLEQKVDPNMCDIAGNTALHLLAARRPDENRSNRSTIDWMKTLLDSGADLNTENAASLTPLAIACALHSKDDVIDWLCSNGADFTMNGLLHATVELGIAAGQSIEWLGCDATQMASGAERWDRFQLALSAGADPHATHDTKSVLQHLCSSSFPRRCVAQCLDAAAAHVQTDVRIATKLFALGLTADCDCFRTASSCELVQCLVEHGTDPNADPNDGSLPPLHEKVYDFMQNGKCQRPTLVQKADLAIIQQLLESDANPNAVSSCNGSNVLVSMAEAIANNYPVHTCMVGHCDDCEHIWQACKLLLEVILPHGASFEGHAFDTDNATGVLVSRSCFDLLSLHRGCIERFGEVLEATDLATNAGSPLWRP